MKTYEWDDMITLDDSEIDPRNLETLVLSEGVYPFTVIKAEQGQFPGSGKIPSCNMAKILIRIDRKGLCSEAFFTTKSMEWKAASFLSCVGKRKQGNPIVWKDLLQCKGSTGYCDILVDTYIDKYGSTKECNRVKEFICYEGGRADE